MGFYFRKSISAGPFRFNLSGSGIGMSVGVKGFRVGTGPRVNYVHMGRGGLYYRASLGGRPRAASSRASAPRYVPPAQPVDTATQMMAVETGDVLEMAPSNGSEIIDQINEKLALLRVWPWALALGAMGSLFLLSHPELAPLGAAAAVATAIATAIAVRWDQSRRCVVIMYDLADEAAAQLKAFADEFDKVASATRVWNIDTAGHTSDWKRNAGASRLITRRAASLGYDAPSVLKTNISVPCIKGGRQHVYFLPDVVLIVEGNRAGALAYDQLQIYWNTTVFIETDGVPSDSQIVGYTWRFVNKKGGPDRRFNNNRQIPEVQYQQMGVQGGGGLQKVLHLSKVADRTPFDTALNNLRTMVRGLQHLALPSPQAAAPSAASPPAEVSEQPASHPESWLAQNWAVVVLAACLLAGLALIGANNASHVSTGAVSDALPPPAAPTVQAAAVGPSFDCAKVHSRVLKLVCATPELAIADQELAAAYSVTLMKVRAKHRLAASETAWLKRRNRAPLEVPTLLKMYQQRVAYLRSLTR